MTRRCSRRSREGSAHTAPSSPPATRTPPPPSTGSTPSGATTSARSPARSAARSPSSSPAARSSRRSTPSCGRPPLGLLRRTAALAAVTRALRKPFALVGVGAAPLHGASARGLARAIVRAADLLILRDEESAAHLAAIGAPTPIRVGADAAWTLLPGEARRAVARRRRVVVALSHLAGRPDARREARRRPAADRRRRDPRCGSIRGRWTATPSSPPTLPRGWAATR